MTEPINVAIDQSLACTIVPSNKIVIDTEIAKFTLKFKSNQHFNNEVKPNINSTLITTVSNE